MSSTNAIDLDDPRLEPYRDLRAGAGGDSFIVEGTLAVERLLTSARFEVESLVCTPSARARLDPLLPAELPVYVLEKAALATLVGFDFHRGVLACVRRPPPQTELDPALLATLRARPRLTVVMAVGLADPRNLGALVRNTAAFAVDLLIADRHGADLFARQTARTSVGNVFRLPTLVAEDVVGTIEGLRRELGLRVLAATPHGEQVLGRFARPDRLLVLLGNEGQGLSDALLAEADMRVQIPVDPASDSLNVAAAAAVLLFGLGA